MHGTKKVDILKITLVAVFAACSFVAVWIHIPIPAAVGTPFIHLGNLVVILVSLLFGGVIGGASGAIGMGLYDIIKGYGVWTIKTVVLKFILGLVVGYIYQLVKKKNFKHIVRFMYILGAISLIMSITTLALAIANNGAIYIEIINKNLRIDWTLYTFSFILGAMLILSAIFSHKLSKDIQRALLACTCGVFINIIGEFLGKVLKQLLVSSPLNVAIIQAGISIPATIINGTISLIAVLFIYAPLKKALGKTTNEKKYEILLIDVDDTILDFKKSSRSAIASVFTKYHIDVTEENVKLYEQINALEWEKFERGEIEKQAMLEERFVLLFDKFNIKIDGATVNMEYLNALEEYAYVIDGAEKMCEQLSKDYKLYIITNGVKKVQNKRLNQTTLLQYFKSSFISEDIGHQKPSKEYFDYVIKQIGETDLSKYLIIGDSLTSDIKGGITYGIDTCWYNPQHIVSNINATYNVDSFEDIIDILIP